MKQEAHVLDIDREKFNPEITRGQYERRGFRPAFINTLVALDTIIYACPPEEIREAMSNRRNAGQ